MPRAIERHEPALPGLKSLSRAQDNYRADRAGRAEGEAGHCSAPFATAVIRNARRHSVNPGLESVSLARQRILLSGQSLPLSAFNPLPSLDCFQSVFKCCLPGVYIRPQGLGKKQQRGQFCAQGQLTLAPASGPSHPFVESGELPAQLSMVRQPISPKGGLGPGSPFVQDHLSRCRLAIDRFP
jgi:hypothetical protein